MSMRNRDDIPAGGRAHLLPLDSMRGLAAMAVVLHHFTGANSFRVTFPELLSVRPLVWLGQRSYSTYMTHVLVIMISEYALRLLARAWIVRAEAVFPGATATAWARGIVAAVLVLSDLTYRFVEQPGSQLLLRRRTARMAAA